MKTRYQQITTTKDSTLYHGGMDQLNGLWRKLSRASLFSEAHDAFTFLNKDLNDSNFQFYIIRSLENQGKLKEAITKVDRALKGKLSKDQKEYYLKYKVDLTKKLTALK